MLGMNNCLQVTEVSIEHFKLNELFIYFSFVKEGFKALRLLD